MDFDVVSRLLFPVPPSSYSAESFPQELICVPRSLNPQTSSPEDCVPLLLLRCRNAKYLFIFLHSNSEDLGRVRNFCASLRELFCVHVLVVEYPGYGICPGNCDDRGATECASTAFRFAREVLRWPAENIVIFGRSIGTGPAVAIAAQNKVGGLILVSPFLSIKEVGRESLGYMANLIGERFPNKDLMPLVKAPCLIVHGQLDTMVPVRHGRRLFELCCAERKKLVSPKDLDHNGHLLRNADYFLRPVREFFALPQSSSDEMNVPGWAFDKRLAMLAPRIPPGNEGAAECAALGLVQHCGAVPQVAGVSPAPNAAPSFPGDTVGAVAGPAAAPSLTLFGVAKRLAPGSAAPVTATPCPPPHQGACGREACSCGTTDGPLMFGTCRVSAASPPRYPPTPQVEQLGRMSADSIEETITGAIEHIGGEESRDATPFSPGVTIESAFSQVGFLGGTKSTHESPRSVLWDAEDAVQFMGASRHVPSAQHTAGRGASMRLSEMPWKSHSPAAARTYISI
eukprot:TRINITY_DN44953_c0_g1_i2.p1 TRINITY_DN44953_c0_g1~~TRINITY_DN44953_c0_g1_i2.p1  ORF type:complete len:513 (+),score=59.38 TRINITY_DN44953_c0_g1_i2:105-1643(+)